MDSLPVYTFYDPDVAGSAFGTYNVLWQLTQAAELNMPYLYLGYWIQESRKMSYKTNFQPLPRPLSALGGLLI